MAPVTRRRKKIALAAAPPPSADRLSRLPEEILAQILSLLPAQEAVRTCVLARTWRDVWKFTRRLRITGASVREVQAFMERLLSVRRDGLKLASLEACEINFINVDDGPYTYIDLDDEVTSSLSRWIQRLLLQCQIQMLRVKCAEDHPDAYSQMMEGSPLVSQHLTRLELTHVWLFCRCVNLDLCPALEHLEINECCLTDVRKIMSHSLKRLVITSSFSDEDRKRIRICVPRLVSLWLDDNIVRTPLLESMPELVAAKVRINLVHDLCHCEDLMACYHVMRDGDILDSDDEEGSDISESDDEEGSFDYATQNTTKCVVLEGLAQAKDLVLISDRSKFIFRRDLRWCPIFSKLKTLVLSHDLWCRPDDCSALACILEHAPVLEKLTLISDEVFPAMSKYKVEMTGHPDATVKSNKISQHLKIVKINCEAADQRFLNVLNFFGALNIRFEIKVTKK